MFIDINMINDLEAYKKSIKSILKMPVNSKKDIDILDKSKEVTELVEKLQDKIKELDAMC